MVYVDRHYGVVQTNQTWGEDESRATRKSARGSRSYFL